MRIWRSWWIVAPPLFIGCLLPPPGASPSRRRAEDAPVAETDRRPPFEPRLTSPAPACPSASSGGEQDGGAGETRAIIAFRNDLSDAFRLLRALFVLDGRVLYNRQDDLGAIADLPGIDLVDGPISVGEHTLKILLNLQGNGRGMYSYLRSYHFEPRSSHTFTAAAGQTIVLQIVVCEKGSAQTPLEDRLAVQYREVLCSHVHPTIDDTH